MSKTIHRSIVVAALFVGSSLAAAQAPKGSGDACWNPSPFYCEGNLCCQRVLQLYTTGFCAGSGNSQCSKNGNCPTDCKVGTVTPDQQAWVKATVTKHPEVVPVFIGKTCYEGALGKALLDEATRQEKAIRFFVAPENMTPEALEAYNKHISNIQREMSIAEHRLAKNPPEQ